MNKRINEQLDNSNIIIIIITITTTTIIIIIILNLIIMNVCYKMNGVCTMSASFVGLSE
jgi:hypothetical protein